MTHFYKEINAKLSSAKWQPFHHGLNELMSRQFNYLRDDTQTFIGKNGLNKVFKATCHKPIWNGTMINTTSQFNVYTI